MAVILRIDGDNRIVLSAGANGALLPGDAEVALDELAKADDVFLTQMECASEATLAALASAHRRGMYTIVNVAPPRELPPAAWHGIDLVCVNETECEAITGINPSDEGCLANTRSSQNGRLRLAWYENALADHGIAADSALVCEGDYHGASGYSAVDALVAAGATAIFSTSDLMTLGVVRRLSELGLRVPEDVSVVSFDRNEASAFFLPNVTSVRQDVGQLSSRAFDLLGARMGGSRAAYQLQVIEPELVIGSSVAAPRA